MSRVQRTMAEKEQLINDFKSSNQSMKTWCLKNNVPVSSLSGWISKQNKHATHLEKECKFIEINAPLKESDTVNTADILIECNSCIIHVFRGFDSLLLEEILKVVKKINV